MVGLRQSEFLFHERFGNVSIDYEWFVCGRGDLMRHTFLFHFRSVDKYYDMAIQLLWSMRGVRSDEQGSYRVSSNKHRIFSEEIFLKCYSLASLIQFMVIEVISPVIALREFHSNLSLSLFDNRLNKYIISNSVIPSGRLPQLNPVQFLILRFNCTGVMIKSKSPLRVEMK